MADTATPPVVNSSNLASCFEACSTDDGYINFYNSEGRGGSKECVADCKQQHSGAPAQAPAQAEQAAQPTKAKKPQSLEDQLGCGGFSFVDRPATLSIGWESCKCYEDAKTAQDCDRSLYGMDLGAVSEYRGTTNVSIEVLGTALRGLNGLGISVFGPQYINKTNGAAISIIGDQWVSPTVNGLALNVIGKQRAGDTNGAAVNVLGRQIVNGNVNGAAVNIGYQSIEGNVDKAGTFNLGYQRIKGNVDALFNLSSVSIIDGSMDALSLSAFRMVGGNADGGRASVVEMVGGDSEGSNLAAVSLVKGDASGFSVSLFQKVNGEAGKGNLALVSVTGECRWFTLFSGGLCLFGKDSDYKPKPKSNPELTQRAVELVEKYQDGLNKCMEGFNAAASTITELSSDLEECRAKAGAPEETDAEAEASAKQAQASRTRTAEGGDDSGTRSRIRTTSRSTTTVNRESSSSGRNLRGTGDF